MREIDELIAGLRTAATPMDTLFFCASKLVWALISPDSLLAPTCARALLVAFLPLGEWVMYPLERRFPEARLMFTGGSGGLTTQDFKEAGHLLEWRIASKEWVGLLAYYLTGKSDRLLPAETSHCSPLAD